MLARVVSRNVGLLRPFAARGFAGPQNHPMIDSEFNAPSSQTPLYVNEFDMKSPAEFAEMAKKAQKHPVVHDPKGLIPSDSGDPHQTYGMAEWKHIHYDVTREPTFPRKPDISKGELAAGAQVYRTDVWNDPKEPAITSIAKFSPENFRPVGYYENALTPETCVPEGHLDFRTNRLNLDHADRRPYYYMLTAGVGFIGVSIIRSIVTKAVHSAWPSKDVFAAGVVEVDLRAVKPGIDFVVKWRGKPVFVRNRTPEQIEKARKDDCIAASMRDPETDAQRAPRAEWLIMIGSCTHLGCIPFPDAGNWGGWFCPCHGSHYDHSGRIRQGPAPKNLEVPAYSFLNDLTVKIG